MRGVRHDALRGLLEAQGPLLGLIGLIFGIYIFQALNGPGWDMPFMAVPARVVEAWEHIQGGVFGMDEVKALGPLVTCAFLHASPEHVIGNMLGLWIFAALAAELVGHRWVFAVFLITAFTGSLFHVALNAHENVPSLGASGAVMGFEGFYLGMAVRWRLPTPHIWPMSRPVSPTQLAMVGVIYTYFDFTSLMSKVPGNIAYGAHLGGFVGGVVLASLLPRLPRGATVRHH